MFNSIPSYDPELSYSIAFVFITIVDTVPIAGLDKFILVVQSIKHETSNWIHELTNLEYIYSSSM